MKKKAAEQMYSETPFCDRKKKLINLHLYTEGIKGYYFLFFLLLWSVEYRASPLPLSYTLSPSFYIFKEL